MSFVDITYSYDFHTHFELDNNAKTHSLQNVQRNEFGVILGMLRLVLMYEILGYSVLKF